MIQRPIFKLVVNPWRLVMHRNPRSLVQVVLGWPHRQLKLLLLVILQVAVATIWTCAAAQADTATHYTHMVPLSAYLSKTKSAEIALARSAAPAEISGHAKVLTFGPHGYDVAVKGSNGFVCYVERAWANKFDSINFWNPQFRAPTCLNPAAARTILPIYLHRTGWVLAGMSQSEMAKRTDAAVADKTLSAPMPGAMSYMMSKQQILCGPDGSCGKWYPHVMFYYSSASSPDWAANLKGVPVFSSVTTTAPATTVLMVLVPRWSDQTPSPASESH
jgi:hypothetical protein